MSSLVTTKLHMGDDELHVGGNGTIGMSQLHAQKTENGKTTTNYELPYYMRAPTVEFVRSPLNRRSPERNICDT